MPVQRLNVAILPLELPCSGPITHSGEILTTGKSYGKKPNRFSLNEQHGCGRGVTIEISKLKFLVY